MRDYLSAALLPFLLLCAVVVIEVLALADLIPSQGHLIGVIGKWLAYQGTFAIVGISLAENIVGFGVYFPGSLAILTAMATTSGNPSQASFVWLAITMGAMSGQLINFGLGRRVSGRGGIPVSKKISAREFWLTFWHPQFASVTSLRAGQSGIDIYLYLRMMIPSLLLWNVFWGTVMYSWGNLLGDGEGWTLLFIAYLLSWIAYELYDVAVKRKRSFTL
jgi:membrane protein DedA with SNARE-associated domain